MAVHVASTIELARSPATVFAFLDDVARTPEWLARCTRVEKLDPGPNGLGTRLRYEFLQGKKPGVMEGSITAYAPGEHLTFRYADKMFDVSIDFKLAAGAGAATALTHTIDIVPRSLVGTLLQPLIRRVLPKQLATDLAKLRALV